MDERFAEFAQESATEADRRSKRRRWPITVGAGVLVLGVAYVGTAYYVSDKIPADTSISGVPVGGMTLDSAREKLAGELSDDLTKPRDVVAVASEAEPYTVDPAALDLAIDYDGTLDKLVGFSLNPARLWAHISGGHNTDVELTYDDAAMTETISAIAEHVGIPATDAALALSGTEVSVTPAVTGVDLDQEASRDVLVSQWFAGGSQISLPTVESDVALSTEDAQAFADESVAPLLSGPISVNVKDALVELSVEDIAAVLSVGVAEGSPWVKADGEALAATVDSGAGDVLTDAKEATITLVNGYPQIGESAIGETVDSAKLQEDLLAIAGSTSRTIEAVVVEDEPELTTAEAEKLGVKEIVSEISTPLTSDQVRTTNLIVGSKKVTNTLVLPGERFDLQTVLGPMTTDNGFVSSGVWVNGFASTDVGGGISQLATNMFNVGYRAGLVDVAHTPHSVYFDRYPAGLESTIWYDQLFVTWENNTPYGILVESFVYDGVITTRLWSTKYFDVDVWQGDRYNYVQPTTKNNPAADCQATSYSAPGFSIDVGRVVKLKGDVVEDSSYTWTYQPQNAVTCG